MIAAWVLAATTIAPCKPVAFPSVPAKVVWSDRKSDTLNSVLAGKTLIVQRRSHLRALDAATGALRWEAALPPGGPIWPILPVVSGDRLFAVRERELLVIALDNGRVIARTTMPRVIYILGGPPVIAVAKNEPMLGSTLYALDAEGRIRRRRTVRMVHDLWIAGDVIVAELNPNTRDEVREVPQYAIAGGFRADNLKPLWSFGANGVNLQQIGGRWYIGETQWSEMRSIDVRMGYAGARLPAKEPADLTGDDSATWEIDFVTKSPEHGPPCERLRVNDPATGKPRWTIDLPFSITTHLRHGDHFYVYGERHLARLNWRTGAMERLWSGLPMDFDAIHFDRGLILGVAVNEGAAAIRVAD